MKVIIDKKTCIGCGLCTTMHPDIFHMDDKNVAEVSRGSIEQSLQFDCRQAAQDCPVNAIKIEND